MRSVLIGVMVGLAAVAGPAFAGTPDAPCAYVVEVGAPAQRINPCARVIYEDHPNPGAEFGFAVAATALTLLYTPVRMVYGVTGAALGGFSGWVSGGDLRTAKGWWVNTTEGDYYIRPAHLDSTTRFRIIGAVPAYPAPERYDEPLPPGAVELEEDLVVPEDTSSPAGAGSVDRRGG
jgi:hypothetical protein